MHKARRFTAFHLWHRGFSAKISPVRDFTPGPKGRGCFFVCCHPPVFAAHVGVM